LGGIVGIMGSRGKKSGRKDERGDEVEEGCKKKRQQKRSIDEKCGKEGGTREGRE
jgi:hypothetical protein